MGDLFSYLGQLAGYIGRNFILMEHRCVIYVYPDAKGMPVWASLKRRKAAMQAGRGHAIEQAFLPGIGQAGWPYAGMEQVFQNGWVGVCRQRGEDGLLDVYCFDIQLFVFYLGFFGIVFG